MTHLGLGSSLEGPLGKPTRRGGGSVAFPGGSIDLLGGLGGPMPRGAPTALPKRPGWITALTCLGRPKGMR